MPSSLRLLRRKLGLETFGEDSFPGTFEVPSCAPSPLLAFIFTHVCYDITHSSSDGTGPQVDDDVDESSGPSTPHVEATPIRTAFSKRFGFTMEPRQS